MSGVLVGKPFLEFIPIDKTVIKRSVVLKSWMEEIFQNEKLKWAEYTDWFDFRDFDNISLYIWTPSPCIADVCVERLVEIYHIWPNSSHMFVAPALMTSLWRKQLSKAADVLFNIVEGVEFWPDGMHEPLTLAILCPISYSPPFKVKRHEHIDKWKCHMSTLWGESTSVIRAYLRKLWNKI